MTEISPGIHWLKLPNAAEESSLSHVNIYLFRGDNGYLLVDEDSGSTRSESLKARYLFNNVGSRHVAITTFNADGSSRGTLHRDFTFR